MALDDYLLAYTAANLVLHRISQNHSIFCIKYRVEYLIKLSKSKIVRSLILRTITKLALTLSNARLICFDERFDNFDKNTWQALFLTLGLATIQRRGALQDGWQLV